VPARRGESAPGRASAIGAGAQHETGRAVATVQAGFAQGGQHALAAELLLFIGIVALRAVATYGPAPKGGKDLPADQYGPLFILGNGFAVFFVLAFLAARGGTSAKVAVAGGAIIDLALLMKSIPHIDQIAAVYGEPRKYVPENVEAVTPSPEAPVLSPALQLELSTRQLPGKAPAPGGPVMAYARKSLTTYGLKLSEFPDLVRLWNQESGWRWNATNPSSGAYGIPQALPASKLASAGGDWKTNPYTQIRWGLQYIRDRYGSIAAAWAHEQHFNWY
jgi:hypothetical protein